MTFTGRAIRQGNTDRFGVGGPGGFTRAASPLGDTLYVFLAGGIIAITDLANGSGTLINYQGNPGGATPGGAFEHSGTLYFTMRGGTDSLRSINVSTGATTHVANLSREIGACATDGTTVWAYESSSNKLFSLNPTNGNLTEIGDVTFPSGTTENGVQGMFYWADEGRLYIVGGNTDRLYRLPAFADNPTTWLAEAVDATVTTWGVTQAGVAGATVFDGEAYMIGGSPDALYQFERDVGPLSIEAIDEQSIPVLTEDYVLEIDIGGEPTRAYVDGDMEGFYHEWDPDNAKIRIKSEQVTRLISAAIWNVHLVRGTDTLNSQIVFNVVPTAPVIADPGAQKLYKGGLFSLNMDIANKPAIARGSGLLSGLKYAGRTDGADGLNIEGRLPADANLTEAAFNAAIYAENNGGTDNLSVPITIETHQGVYVFNNSGDDLLKIGPDAATLRWTYEAPSHRFGTDYDSIVASPDGIYLFNDGLDDLLKVSPDGDLLWTFSDAGSGTYDDMIVTASGVYVHRSLSRTASQIGEIYKIHPATGEVIWSSALPYTSFLVFDGDVYLFNDTPFITVPHNLMRLDGETGAVLWTYEAAVGSYPTPAIAGDGVYLRNRNTLLKINRADGTEDWTYRLSGQFFSPLGAYNDAVYVSTNTNNAFYKVNASNGSLAWTFNAPFSNVPFYESDGIYLDDNSTQHRLLKLNFSGTQDWLFDAPNSSFTPIFHPNGIYFTSRNDNLIKVNRSNGTQDWLSVVSGIRFSALIIEDGSDLYAITSYNNPDDVVGLRVSDGNEQWRYTPSSGSGDYGSLAIPDFQL